MDDHDVGPEGFGSSQSRISCSWSQTTGGMVFLQACDLVRVGADSDMLRCIGADGRL